MSRAVLADPVLATRRMRAEPWKLHLPARTLIQVVGKGLEVPEAGWTAREFASQGRLLLLTLHRVARLTQRRAAAHIAQVTSGILRRQLDYVIDEVRSRMGGKSSLLGLLPQHGDLWMQALDDVIAEERIGATAELLPPVQSVMGQAYSRTATLLGQQTDPDFSTTIAQRSREIAQHIVGITDTTRQMFQRTIENATRDGLTVTETAERLRQTMTQFNANRINTIARTETNNAWTRGSVASFQESPTLTHVSVIGCESREPERWGQPSYEQFMLRGESTCNIQDVPVGDAHKLNFHPNHTGTVIPSRFRDDDSESISTQPLPGDWTKGAQIAKDHASSNLGTTRMGESLARIDEFREFEVNQVSRQRYADYQHEPTERDVQDVRALYKETQEKLTGRLPARMFRGIQLDEDVLFREGQEFSVPNSTSWTEDQGVANRYAEGGLAFLDDGESAQIAELRVTMPNEKVVAHYGLGALDETSARSDREVITGGMRLRVDTIQDIGSEEVENENGDLITVRRLIINASVVK